MCGTVIILCAHVVFDHDFSQKSTDWGYSSFMKWKVQHYINIYSLIWYKHNRCVLPPPSSSKDVTDPAKGFIKDDSIILVSYIKVIRCEEL